MRSAVPALALVLCAGVPALAAPGDNTSHSSVPVTERVSKLVVDVRTGGVTVRRGRAGSVDITKTWQGQEPTVSVKVSGGVLTVTGECPGLIDTTVVYVSSFSTCTTAIVVTLPASALDTKVDTYGAVSVTDFAGTHDLSSGSGAVTVAKTSGRLTLDANGGNVSLRDLSATSLDLGAGSGGVTVERVTVSGKATLDTNGGSVRLLALRAAALDVGAGSGSVTLDQVTTTGGTTVSTNGGTVKITTLRAPSLSLTSGSGQQSLRDVVVSAPLRLGSNGGAVTVSGSRAPSVDVASGSGDVRIQDVTTSTVQVDTNGGAIDVSGTAATAYDLASGSGNVALVTRNAPASVKVDTNGGRVDVTVARGAYGLVVSQNGGRLTLDGITPDSRSKRSLDLTSGSADITVLGR